jgi:glycosyltransferase involved in cell wall biosynthesis
MIVGMSGHASQRKGVDIFFEAACALPDHDFLWVGGWRPEETIDNVVFESFERVAPPNLYISGAVDNPYPYMDLMDMFFLSSREDPNPLVLGEALALAKPVLCFSRATGAADRLGRWATLCHGEANAKDAVRVLRACNAAAVRRPEFRSAGQAYLADYDLKAKMGRLYDLIARLRGETAPQRRPPPAQDAAKRELEGGVLELTFS